MDIREGLIIAVQMKEDSDTVFWFLLQPLEVLTLETMDKEVCQVDMVTSTIEDHISGFMDVVQQPQVREIIAIQILSE